MIRQFVVGLVLCSVTALASMLSTSAFELYDVNGDGQLSRREFTRYWILQDERNGDEKADYYGHLYQLFDKNFDLKLDAKEIERLLAVEFHLRSNDKIFADFDVNHDGKLDVFEFLNFDRKFRLNHLERLADDEAEMIDEIADLDSEIDEQTPKESRKFEKFAPRFPKKYEKLPMMGPKKAKAMWAKSRNEVVQRLVPLPTHPEDLRPMLTDDQAPKKSMLTVF